MARALRLVATVAVALALVIALLLFLQARDRSTLGNDAQTGATVARLTPDQGDAHHAAPAGFRFATDPPTSGPHVPVAIRATGRVSRDALLHALELGDVVLVYGDPADAPALRALRDDVAGDDPALVRAGQAILLDLRPGTSGVVAVAWRRLLRTAKPDDPRLRTFAGAFLGHGAGP